mmetsp:Transcript_42426/g.76054  ORF Transcript_42426/g.76054 Transcript_42426/m.76054 type:complete len:328 (-) Transcript_42426:191-1174(-)
MIDTSTLGKERSTFVVGYAAPPKKKKFMAPFADFLRGQGVVCHELAFSTKCTQPVDVLVHKMLAGGQPEGSDASASEAEIRNLKEYVKSLPQLIVVDPLECMQVVLDRYVFQTTLQASGVLCPPCAIWQGTCDAATAVELNPQLQFPLVCKSIQSCGSNTAHEVVIVHTLAQLRQVVLTIPLPLMLQNYIRHDGMVWKVYVIGPYVWVGSRGDGQDATFCDANKPSVHVDNMHVCRDAQIVCDFVMLTEDCHFQGIKGHEVQDIVRKVSAATGLNIFGIDLIVDITTGNPYCVDLNYFPGYKEVHDVYPCLLNYLRSVVSKARTVAL